MTARPWNGMALAVEFDLAKDVGLSGAYTVTIENPVVSKSSTNAQ